MTDFSHGFHIFMDGNMWCAVGPHFRDLQSDHAGFGETPAAAYLAWWGDNRRLNAWRGHSEPGLDRFIIHHAIVQEAAK